MSFQMKLMFVALTSLFVIGCSKNDSNPTNPTTSKSFSGPLFSLQSSNDTGLDFLNKLEDNPLNDNNILSFAHYFNGAGVAIGDINNDGLADVFFSGNEVSNKLFLNKGDFKFEDISEKAAINVNKKWSTGASMADINGDGFVDIYVCQYGPNKDRRNTLYINNGDLTFTEKAAEYGLDDGNESIQAAFFDFDKDGDLDCFVMNESKYVRIVHKIVFEELKDKNKLAAASSNMFRNDGGKFTKITEEAGMLAWNFGLGLCVSDINEDGWPDVYVANDYSVPDHMYINNGDGTFTDEIKERTKQISFFAMGLDVADFSNDGHVDIGSVDMATSDHFRGKTLMESMNIPIFWYYINKLNYPYQYMFNTLQLNNGEGKFNNVAHLSGMGQTEWSWAALFADFDNDGWKDYFVSNGFRRYSRDNDFMNEMSRRRAQNGGNIPLEMRKEMYDKMPEIKLPNQYFKNNGNLDFEEVASGMGLGKPSYSNGTAYGDLDNDGDLDMIVSNIDHPAFVYKNNAVEQGRGNWLQVDLKGENAKTILAGAKVTIETEKGIQFQELNPVRGYMGCQDPTLHFGVGELSQVEKVTVVWPDGKQQVQNNVKTNQRITITKSPSAAVAVAKISENENQFFKEINPSEIGVNATHVENEFDDFSLQILLPHRQSTAGPKVRTGDLNGDGLDDFFVCGAANQTSQLYFQKSNGTFELSATQPWTNESGCEDMDALFLDADKDGDLDIYIVSGGYEIPENSEFLTDRLYINFGKGNFKRVQVPTPKTSGFVAKSTDYDMDGDADIFIGGGTKNGRYPFSEKSYILRNEGRGFKDVTEEIAPELSNIGLVKDALWTDLNGDNQPDLVVVGEWMPITVFENNNGKFTNASAKYGTADLKGWWYSIAEADLNNDGNKDLIVGNIGLNNKFHPSKKKPFKVFANDFDKTGTCDVVLSKEYKGKLVPTRGKECSSDQMPFIDNKFPSYKEFANASLDDILGEKGMEEALKLEVNGFESIVLMNTGTGAFKEQSLPKFAQVAPIMGIIPEDIDKDGNMDLIIAGNMYGSEVETPRYDASDGLVLKGDGTGNFKPITVSSSGLYLPGNVKSIAKLKSPNGDLILAGNNDDKLQIFKIAKNGQLSMK